MELTLATLAVNEALLCPAVTATLAGSVILALLLDSATAAPDGTAAVNVTVQLEVPGAFTVDGRTTQTGRLRGDRQGNRRRLVDSVQRSGNRDILSSRHGCTWSP